MARSHDPTQYLFGLLTRVSLRSPREGNANSEIHYASLAGPGPFNRYGSTLIVPRNQVVDLLFVSVRLMLAPMLA